MVGGGAAAGQEDPMVRGICEALLIGKRNLCFRCYRGPQASSGRPPLHEDPVPLKELCADWKAGSATWVGVMGGVEGAQRKGGSSVQ